jgi:2,3-bisphosphoglycerate-independent phosphoglycerate mutase
LLRFPFTVFRALAHRNDRGRIQDDRQGLLNAPMKYCVVIIDGAAGWSLPQRGGKTCLELAKTPNLDAMAEEATIGLVRTVPPGMEPSSACACMSLLGYDPKVYYRGRSGIEARSMGIPIEEGEVVFRCNLVAVRDGKMWSYSSGHISTDEAKQLIASLNENLGSDEVHFYPGVSYRHICNIKGHKDTLSAACTPPHDIPDKPIAGFLPSGAGSDFLRDLMEKSKFVLEGHQVNIARRSRGDIPATMIWLFWGSGRIPDMPPFKQVYGLDAALTSGVDLLRGLAGMVEMEVLNIPGVTDGLNNDYAAQVKGALEALKEHDLVVIHVEAPDEAAHGGAIDDKMEAIQKVDGEIVSRIRNWDEDAIRVLIMPDHATPVKIQTHTDEPVPFMLWGKGFEANGAKRFTEAEAKGTGFFIDEGYNIMGRLVSKEI